MYTHTYGWESWEVRKSGHVGAVRGTGSVGGGREWARNRGTQRDEGGRQTGIVRCWQMLASIGSCWQALADLVGVIASDVSLVVSAASVAVNATIRLPGSDAASTVAAIPEPV